MSHVLIRRRGMDLLVAFTLNFTISEETFLNCRFTVGQRAHVRPWYNCLLTFWCNFVAYLGVNTCLWRSCNRDYFWQGCYNTQQTQITQFTHSLYDKNDQSICEGKLWLIFWCNLMWACNMNFRNGKQRVIWRWL